ncbi:MAG: protein phosphatase 2C domain-containing protein [Saccharofermentans sp.]|nr:protein phosphatase 2C domain-containing protein [Saccharofermentans sp.]
MIVTQMMLRMPELSDVSGDIIAGTAAGAILFLVSIFLFGLVIYLANTKYRKIDINMDILTPEVAYFHEKGKREAQEDSVYISELVDYKKTGIVACVSDGMGGLAYGDEVSQYVVENISNLFPLSFFATEENARNIRRISDYIADHYKQQAGATLAMVNILNNYLNFYSVGDSVIMLVRKGETTVLNQKQNYGSLLIHSLVKKGQSTSAVYGNPKFRALTDFMGNVVVRVLYSVKPIRVYDGDTIIVCSDGVTDALSGRNIAQHCSHVSAANTASNIKMAVKGRKNPRQDNFTAVVIKLGKPVI